MRFNKFKIIISLLLIIVVYQQIWRSIGRDTYIDNISKFIPISVKISIQETFFKNKMQNIEIEKLKKENEKLNEILIQNDRDKLALKFKLREPIRINHTEDKKFKIFNENFSIKKFETPYNTPKHYGKGTAYLAIGKKNIYIVGAGGLISYIEKDEFLSEESYPKKINPINTNLKQIITDDKFYSQSTYGIKGALTFKNQIFISYTKEVKKDCYNTSLLVADLNTYFLNFKDFFAEKACVEIDNDYGEFTAHQSGGKILAYDINHLLLSVGEYRYRDHAQDKSNYFGKIIKINLNTKKYEILSMGHRNVHGMYYDKDAAKIFSVEHGPDGGCEININELSSPNIKNFGWPISSYGDHYAGKREDEGENIRIKYEKAPFYKSHEKYGFLEPAFYFLPSLGPSSVSKVPNTYFDKRKANKNRDYIIVGTLGWKKREGEKSIHFFKFENNKLVEKDFFELQDRVRDIIYDHELDVFYLWTETTASISVLKKI